MDDTRVVPSEQHGSSLQINLEVIIPLAEREAAATAGIRKDTHRQNCDHMPLNLSILFFCLQCKYTLQDITLH